MNELNNDLVKPLIEQWALKKRTCSKGQAIQAFT